MSSHTFSIPPEVANVSSKLEDAGFEAYLVGGCVRDLALGKKPKDWDITTNAAPEKIQEIFEHTFYENAYGTVGVVTEHAEDETLKVIEVTPYRTESTYSDRRRPDSVSFSDKLEDDLKRRDFTVNALAYSVSEKKLIDLYSGQEDLKRKSIVAVGEAKERFSEDALRMLRAVRLAAELGFSIEHRTAEAIQDNAHLLEHISKERIRDELIRIVESPDPMMGIILAHKLGVLSYVIPDLERGIGIEQNQAHKFEVFEHNLRTLQHAADKKWPLEVRLAALFHDISKPEARRWSKEKNDWTFHGHEVVGARVTKKVLTNLKFSTETIDKVVKLVRWHMFFSDPDQVTLSAVRRTIRNVGQENIEDLLNLRVCDRIGTGRPKEQPFRFRKYKSMVEEALRDPISVSMLKLKGEDIMQLTSERPGPRIGWMLHALLEEVLDDPKKNARDYLEKRVSKLSQLSNKELSELGEAGKNKRESFEEDAVKLIRAKYWVN
jgi:putative nucleotidyltransferase with HDIG domain